MIVKLLIEHYLEFLSFKGGCTGSSESTLVKMPHCWKLHVAAHKKFLIDWKVSTQAQSQKLHKEENKSLRR